MSEYFGAYSALGLIGDVDAALAGQRSFCKHNDGAVGTSLDSYSFFHTLIER